MHAELFLENFERLVGAPGGIEKLRGLILQLAVQGKLVPQVASDEPAWRFLARLGSTKKLNADYFRPLPKGWSFAPLTVFGDFRGGLTPSKARSEYWGEGIDWVSPKDMAGDAGNRITSAKDQITELALSDTTLSKIPSNSILMVARSGILKRKFPVATTGVECTVNQDMKAIVLRETSIARFLQIMLLGWEPRILRDFVKTGTTVQSLKFSEFKSSLWPIPPLAEQKRIVAKVDELMALCDRLDEEQTNHIKLKRAASRSILHDASVDREAKHAPAIKFSLNSKFDAWFNDRETIHDLRASILFLACHGKLQSEGNVIKSMAYRVETASSDDGRWPLPSNWKWTTLGSLTSFITSGSRGWKKYYSDKGAKFIRSQDIKTDAVLFDEPVFVALPGQVEGSRTRVKVNDLLLTITGANTGKCALVADELGEAYVSQHVALIRPIKSAHSAFLHLWLTGSWCGRSILLGVSYGIRAGLNLNQLRKLPVPLPPLTEQKRTVANARELISLCDRLEAQVNEGERLDAALMDALIHHLTTAPHHEMLGPSTTRAPAMEIKSASPPAPNVVPLPRKCVPPPTPAAQHSMSVDSKFQEAVLVGAIVKAFFDDGGEPIGNFRLQKAVYFARRHGGEKALDEEYLKKAAGPYNPKMKYSGGIAIAKKKGYIREARGRYGFGHIVGSEADELSDYLGRDHYAPYVEAANWVRDTFKFKKNDDWERLATVDYAILDLEARGNDVTGQAILNYIRSDAEWAPKIAKLELTAARLDNLIHDTRTLFATVGQADGG